MRLIALAAIGAILLISPEAAACYNDRDCPAASRCVKLRFGDPTGVCKHGVEPIEGERQERVPTKDGPKLARGEACQFHAECADGLQCLRDPNGSGQFCSY
jgi:hypothetical protein